MTRTHRTTLELSQAIPQAVDVGASITLQVKVTCASGCDLRGQSVAVTAPDRRVAAAELVTHAEAANETAPLTLQAPREVGEHVWSLVFATPDAAENAHDECVLPIAFATTPHETSVAVWDVPSPVAIDSRFTAKVGARCSAGCEMTGHAIEVRDQCGARVGGGTLGDTPWPGTSALRWTEIELTAPGAVGLAFWTIHVSREGLALAHSDASAAFSFKVEPRPEHRVTLRIVGEDTQAAIAGAEVRLGVYRGTTDDEGVAVFVLPKGRYDLTISSDGYGGPATAVTVNADAVLEIEAVKTMTAAEQEANYERWELNQWG